MNIVHLPLTVDELNLIDSYFDIKELKKKEFLVREGHTCDTVGFIVKGILRHFHLKDGIEKTYDISLEHHWITDFHSIMTGAPCMMSMQAMENTTLLVINREKLFKLYNECPKYETFGRLMAEQIAAQFIEIIISFSSDKPEERVNNLLVKHPELFQRIPQKYIAEYLGISAESLSRIKRRTLYKAKSNASQPENF